jgi:hypothetical protein
VIEISVNEDELSVKVADFLDIVFIKSTHFCSQHVVSRIAGYMDRQFGGEFWILAPELRVVLTPGKQMG